MSAIGDVAEAFGVAVDGPSFVSPSVSMRRIGLVTAFEGGALSDDVLDALILYANAGVATFLELPADVDVPDVQALVRSAAVVGAGICLVPPACSYAGMDAYLGRISAFAGAYCVQGNFEKELLPLTGSLRGMYARAVSEDVPPVDLFGTYPVPTLDAEGAARIDAACVRSLEGGFGGPEAFREHADACAMEVRTKLEREVAARLSPTGVP